MKRVEVVQEVPLAKNAGNPEYAKVLSEVVKLKAGSWAVYECKDAKEASALVQSIRHAGKAAHARKGIAYIATGPMNGAKCEAR